MAAPSILKVEIVSDYKPQGTRAAESDLDKLGRTATVASAAIVAGLGAAAVASVNAASDQEQAFGALESVFGDNAKAMKAWADSTADIGLSAAESAQAAATLGASLKASGLDAADAAAQSQTLVELGADLAATFGGTTSDAVGALGAALRGEYDSLERFGTSIKQADVNARLAANGQDALTGSALKAAEQEARLGLIMEQTADAQGQAARESDTVAASQQQLAAEVANLAAQLGEALLPYAEDFLGLLTGIADWVSRNTGLVVGLAAVIGTLAATVLAVNAALAAYAAIATVVRGVIAAWNVVQGILNVLLITNPVGLLVTAIVALVAIIGVVLYATRDKWIPVLKQLWEWIKLAADVVWGALGSAVSWLGDRISWVVDQVRNLISWLDSLIGKARSAVDFINPFGGAAPSVNVTGAPSRTVAAPTVGGTTINVAGGINPHMTGKAVARLVDGARLRTGYRGIRG